MRYIQIFLFGLLLTVANTFVYAQTASLTFRVDMSKESVSPKGVHVAGSFQAAAGLGNDWNPGSTPMSDPDGDKVFERTVDVTPGVYYYKFVNGNSWDDKPELPAAACAVNDGGGNFNREIAMGNDDRELPVVVFDSCNTQLFFSVNMNGQTISAEGVHVMGDFQQAAGFSTNWDPSSIRMQDLNQDGTYEAVVTIVPGTYNYLFVNGNTQAGAESPPVECTVDGAGGKRYRSIIADAKANSPLTYCFNSCETCDPVLDTDYETHWWNDAVFYEIFVRSFYDSDDDGIGDFRGLIEKLDYLNDGDPGTDTDLGVTGIWLMPMMPSPSYHGYDVTNYYAIEPDYGTMNDFEEFLAAAHDRGIKVILDLVLNHTSSQHPWFSQSANSQNGFRDWFIWSGSDPGYPGPWGQTVWHWRNGAYYYGLFWSGMPDLNYSHPPVKEEMFQVAEFWLDKGVDGYRLDAIKYLDEDGVVLENTPETFQLLEEFNAVYKTADPGSFTVGEVWSNTASVAPYVQNDRLDACFDFDLAGAILHAVNNNDPAAVRNQMQVIQQSYPALQFATFLTNHDIDRVFGQLGSDLNKMKQAASLYLTLPGVPFIYYGEEVGMEGGGPDPIKRRPMQWDSSLFGGFSQSFPWQDLGSNYETNNVAVMEQDSLSLLNHYKKLIHLRNSLPALRRGYFLEAGTDDPAVLGYTRIYEEEAVLVLSNFGAAPSSPKVSLPVSTLPAGNYRVRELYHDRSLGIITLDAKGGFANWEAPAGELEVRKSWLLQLSLADPSAAGEAGGADFAVSVFPNPVREELYVKLDGHPGKGSEVSVFSANGELQLRQPLSGEEATIDTEGWPSGIYFIEVSSKKGIIVRTVAKY